MALYEYTGSGALVLSGAATTSKTVAHPYIGSGGAIFSGTSSVSTTKAYTPADAGVNTGGHALKKKTKAYTGSDGLSIDGGESATEFDPFPVTVIGDYIASGSLDIDGGEALTEVGHSNDYVGAGGLISGGTADPIIITKEYTVGGGDTHFSHSPGHNHSLTKVYPATSGGLIFGGVATTERVHVIGEYTASGGITAGGTADPVITTKVYLTTSGVMTIGGTGEVSTVSDVVGSGGATFGGSASVSALGIFQYTGSGGLTFGGTAPFFAIMVFTPSGGLTLGGTFTRVRTIVRISTGAMILGGAAATGKSGTFVYPATSGGVILGGAATTGQRHVRYYISTGAMIMSGACVSVVGRNFRIEIELFSKKFPPRLIFIPGRKAFHLPGHRKFVFTGSSDDFKFCNTAYPDLRVIAKTGSRDNISAGAGGSIAGGSSLHTKTKNYSPSSGSTAGGSATTSLVPV